jgi:16S rRNA (guanine527-N7)-methyltransferase
MGLPLLKQGLSALGLEGVSEATCADLLWYLEELCRWNRHHNLTAIDDLPSGVEKHLLDSLTLLPFLSGSERLLDIGSGAGLPGLVLKIARPDLDLVSIDGVAKKIRFQRHVIRQLGLYKAQASALRIETLAADPVYNGSFDVIVFRALGGLEQFVPLALPCLAPRGRFLLMKGPEGVAELAAAEGCLVECGLRCLRQQELTLPGSGARRLILELVRSSD